MHVGVSQIDITPAPGGELSGFAARTQPSIGVLDPLFARCLHLVDGRERLLWIHCDLIGLQAGFVRGFRAWAGDALGLAPHQVMLSATHTHAGPPTICLHEAGTYDPACLARLRPCLEELARAAAARSEPCEIVHAGAPLTLAVDRRHANQPYTGNVAAALGLRRTDGAFIAVIANYAMHPVALGPVNRYISADVPGQAALALSDALPGRPVVLMTTGAAGDLNPPAENVPFTQVVQWGQQIAGALIDPLLTAHAAAGVARASRECILHVRSRHVTLPLQALGIQAIEAYAAKIACHPAALSEWGDKFRRAVGTWRTSMIAAVRENRAARAADIELHTITLGPVTFLGANAELFADFASRLGRKHPDPIHVVCYANGLHGYLPTAAAHTEGGYEVELAHLFYNTFPPLPGSHERLLDEVA